MAVRKGCCVGGCLLKTLIAVLVIVILIVGAALWVYNQTLEKLGLGDVKIQGRTLRELGLAQLKVKDVISLIRGILKGPDIDAIANNRFDPIADKQSTEQKLNDTDIPQDSDDDFNYLYLLENQLTAEQAILLEFADTEIAYILDAMVQQGSDDAQEAVEIIRELNADFVQVAILKEQDIMLEMMIKIDISNIKNQLPSAFGAIADTVYLNSVNKMSVNNQGMVSTQSHSLSINGMTNQMSEVLINALYQLLPQEHLEEDKDAKEFFNDAFGALFKTVINNIGLVGDAETDQAGIVVGGVNYGEVGVDDHSIKVIVRENA